MDCQKGVDNRPNVSKESVIYRMSVKSQLYIQFQQGVNNRPIVCKES